MKRLVDLILGVTGLLEAEGRSLRRGVVRTAIAVGLVVLAVWLFLGGFAFLALAAYAGLRGPLGRSGAAVVVGAAVMLLALVPLGVARWLSR